MQACDVLDFAKSKTEVTIVEFNSVYLLSYAQFQLVLISVAISIYKYIDFKISKWLNFCSSSLETVLNVIYPGYSIVRYFTPFLYISHDKGP